MAGSVSFLNQSLKQMKNNCPEDIEQADNLKKLGEKAATSS